MDPAWQNVETLLDEILEAARSSVSPREFHAALLDRLVRATAAVGGAIWTQPDGHWRLEYQINLDRTIITVAPQDRDRHASLIQSIAAEQEVRLIPPQAGDDAAGNPTPLLLLFLPLVDGERPVAVAELFQRPEPRSELQQGYLRIAAAAAELAGDYYRNRRLQRLVEQESLWKRFREYSEAVHASLDVKATAYAIANEGCRLLPCDRLSVAIRRGGRYRLAAVTGVDTIQRRANGVRCLERLVERSLRCGLSLSYPGGAEPLPPEIEAALQAYLDEAHVRQLAIHPLRRRDRPEADSCPPLGALVAERFEIDAVADSSGRIEWIAGPAATALANALDTEGLPLIGVSRLLRGAARFLHLDHLPWTLSAAGLIAIALVALAIVPADFSIRVRGELQPQNRYHIFAPSDGIVVELVRDDRDAVQQGEPLAVLRSPALDLQFSEVEGRRRTVQEQLRAVQTARMANKRPAAGDPDAVSLSAEEEQLQEELKSLDEQFRILVQQQRELEIRSPVDGQVLTFDLQRLLAARPVRRGDRLMTVADLNGPWELELQIDDDQSGHVLAARDAAEGRLPVSFLVNSQPRIRYQGQLREVGRATEVDDSGHAVVLAYATLDGETPTEARPGATVMADIHCGRRPLGFVWFRALWEAIQRHLLF